jgi:pectate lyase
MPRRNRTMRPSKPFALGAVLVVVAATDLTTSAHQQRDLGREVLAPNDGWASEGTGTTGGSSDNAPLDVGRLRVTLHHNLFEAIGQRAARVRFGQVHVYNNLYRIGNLANYQYSWGVGIQSQIYAENNFFDVDEDVALGGIIERLNGTAMFETGTLVDRTLGHDNGIPHGDPVSLLDEYNAVTDPDIVDASGTTWIPTLFLEVDRTKEVPNLVRKCAGPFGPSCDSR